MALHSHNTEVRESFMYPTFGFLLSIIFTLAAFAFVTLNTYSTMVLGVTLGILAFFQLFVQFYFFFHLGDSRAKRFNNLMGALGAFSLLVIVLGSYWTMNHLRRNMMPSMVKPQMLYMHNIPSAENELRR